MRKYMLAALLAGTATAPAFAQKEESAFTGPRVEAIVGYDRLQSGDRNDDGVDTSDDDGDESIEGVAYGIGVGYDFDLGGLVLGIEGEFSESSGKQEADETIDGLSLSSRIKTGRDLYVGGRLGFRAGSSTLLYGKVGYTNTNIDSRYQSASDTYEYGANVDGLRLGAGIEQLFGPNLYGKLEYRYSNYKKLDFTDDFDLDNFDADDARTNIDLDRHQVIAGVGFRF